jgi:uncharacterized protein YndB with AHSA1/START domain
MSAIKLEDAYPVSKEKVWAQLTDDALLSAWCMPTKGFYLEKGKEFIFESKPSVFWDGKFYNTVKDFAKNEFLSYTCVNKRSKLESVVCWTLTEEGGGTRLALEHSGFKASHWLTRLMLTAGWKKMLRVHLSKALQ